uniref:NADH-ubiquinone oxidoreductase chain 5 n=1 Tax=Polyplax asiatica TaxID=1425297 RepID=V9PXD3_9NEOP|nr:NADH dehydrogenase subunit 5 [Polyplax asiatica]
MAKLSSFCWVIWLALSLMLLLLVVHLGPESSTVVTHPWMGGPSEPYLGLMLDWISFLFLLMVLGVSSSVFLYSKGYFKKDEHNKFFPILSSFVVSMLVLVSSKGFFMALVGWDLLGISSLCLIFYFKSWSSYNGGLVTFLSNRFGDLLLFSSLGLLLVGGSEWSFPLSSPGPWGSGLMLLGAMTKSAQYPFSAWLPLAMAAPTPVSSLVHSSTLVTAGLFIVVRHSPSTFPSVSWLGVLVSFASVIYACSSALIEVDLKKIIAFSTLSHLGLMVLFVSMGSIEAALVHMLSHASFKSMTFMAAGASIHLKEETQDSRHFSLRVTSSPLVWSVWVFSLTSMAGLPFLSGFISKENLFCNLNSQWEGLLPALTLSLGTVGTAAYSLRILLFLRNSQAFSPFSSNSFGESEKWMSRGMILGLIISLSLCIFLPWGISEEKSSPLLMESSTKSSVFIFMLIGGVSGLTLMKAPHILWWKGKLIPEAPWGLLKLTKSPLSPAVSGPFSQMGEMLDHKGLTDWIPLQFIFYMKSTFYFKMKILESSTLKVLPWVVGQIVIIYHFKVLW